MLGALVWALGSFLLAKEPEGDIERGGYIRKEVSTRPVTTEHVGTSRVDGARDDFEESFNARPGQSGSSSI
jgi:hypothetical protein